jgi:hypothetical protein
MPPKIANDGNLPAGSDQRESLHEGDIATTFDLSTQPMRLPLGVRQSAPTDCETGALTHFAPSNTMRSKRSLMPTIEDAPRQAMSRGRDGVSRLASAIEARTSKPVADMGYLAKSSAHGPKWLNTQRSGTLPFLVPVVRGPSFSTRHERSSAAFHEMGPEAIRRHIDRPRETVSGRG